MEYEQSDAIEKHRELSLYIDKYRANCKSEYDDLIKYIREITIIENSHLNHYLQVLFDKLVFNPKINPQQRKVVRGRNHSRAAAHVPQKYRVLAQWISDYHPQNH